MEPQTIGQRIAARRKELGLSQADLGDRLEVSRQAISKWEADAAIPDVDKLVTLSKLFGVSVGWLLGVEDFQGDVNGQDDAPFTARERELLELLSRPRPMPQWLKIGLIIVAAVTALSLLFNLVGAIWSYRQTQELMNCIQNLGAPEEAGEFYLEDYSFTILPDADGQSATVEFRAVPSYYTGIMTATLQIDHYSTTPVQQKCDWDGTALTTTFELRALTNCEAKLIIQSMDGLRWVVELPDAAISNMSNALEIGDCSVFVGHYGYDAGHLTLYEVQVQANMPKAWRDLNKIWKTCELVVYSETGAVLDKADLLHASPYSEEIRFSDLQVNFTTYEHTFDLTGYEGTTVRVGVSGELWNGVILDIHGMGIQGGETIDLTPFLLDLEDYR